MKTPQAIYWISSLLKFSLLYQMILQLVKILFSKPCLLSSLIQFFIKVLSKLSRSYSFKLLKKYWRILSIGQIPRECDIIRNSWQIALEKMCAFSCEPAKTIMYTWLPWEKVPYGKISKAKSQNISCCCPFLCMWHDFLRRRKTLQQINV